MYIRQLPDLSIFNMLNRLLFANYLFAYAEILQRNMSRLDDWRASINVLPLGSSTFAGSTLPLDHEWETEQLGFSGLRTNSLDAVTDRELGIVLLSLCNMLIMHFSTRCEDIILWIT